MKLYTYISSTRNMLDIVLRATSGGDMAEVQLFVDYLNLNTAQQHRGHMVIGYSTVTCAKQTDTKAMEAMSV